MSSVPAGDTFELVDPDLAMQILRMNMGAILANIGPQGVR